MRKEAFAFLLANLRPQRARVVTTLIVLTVATLLEGFGVGMIVPVLQSLDGISGTEGPFTVMARRLFAAVGLEYSFAALVAVLAVAMLARYALEGMYQHLARVLGSSVTLQLRDRAFRNLMDVPLGFFYSQKTGDLVTTIQTSAMQAGAAVELMLQAIIGGLFITIYFALGLTLSPPLTLVVLGLAALAYFLILPKFRLGFTQGHEEKDAIDRIVSFLIDTLGGIKTVKTFHGEPRHATAFHGLIANFQQLAVRIQDNRILAGLSLEPVIMVVSLGLVVFSVSVMNLPAVYLITFFFIVSRTLPRVKTANAQYLEMLNFLPHALRVKALIDRADKEYLSEGTRTIDTFTDAITFENVTFQYPGTERVALKGITVRFEKNRMTALIGASGGGKSTLVNLVLKHHEPQRGVVRVDGVDLREITRASWHRLIGLVEQDAHLFNMTIRENIAYGRPEATQDDVVGAARLAHADNFIRELPEGYETRVGERGIKLSGGQRQRLALARALLIDPEILVLDEATSSLDTESERLIQRSIEELSRSKTLIVIAHRLSTIAKADRLYVLEDGMVAEEGRPAALLKEGGLYHKYRSLQLLDAPADEADQLTRGVV